MTLDGGIDQLRILGSTNTQTRRLGYVTAICRALDSNYVPLPDLQRRVERWADQNNEKLKSYVSARGEMRRSTRSLAFKRYLKLTQDLQLIADVSGYLRLTKTGRVLVILDRSVDVSEVNPFRIRGEVSLLLLYQLLLLDADYLLPILDLTTAYHRQSELLENAQQRLRRRFDLLQRYAHSPISRSEMVDRARAIAQWTKPVKYSEHLLLPRLHWLLDLELVNWKAFQTEREFRLSDWGDRLLQSTLKVEGEPLVDRRWCQNTLFFAWAKALDSPVTSWSQVPEVEQKTLIQHQVEAGFQMFRTMQYPRISAYQLILFVVLHLLFTYRIVAGFEDIKLALDGLSRTEQSQWSFFWSALDDDGYLLLTR